MSFPFSNGKKTNRIFARLFFFSALIIPIAVSFDAVPADETGGASGIFPASVFKERRDALLVEFNAFARENGDERSFKVKTTDRFLFVYDTTDAYVEWLAALTAKVADAFDHFCNRLDLETTELREPLTIVVFATREEFDAYAAKDRGLQYLENPNKPAGFYNIGSNRSVIYDRTGAEAARVASGDGDKGATGGDFSRRRVNSEARAIKERTDSVQNASTIVHEITHQLSYNYGIFSRYYRTPDWVVEGMATTFEPTDFDAPLGWSFRNVFPTNETRLKTFVRAANQDERLAILDDVVRSDRFGTELDADGYAASWALFYFCYRRKSKELKKYLTTLQRRDPRRTYSEDERTEEFETCFGDLQKFKKQFVSYIRKLNEKQSRAQSD